MSLVLTIGTSSLSLLLKSGIGNLSPCPMVELALPSVAAPELGVDAVQDLPFLQAPFRANQGLPGTVPGQSVYHNLGRQDFRMSTTSLIYSSWVNNSNPPCLYNVSSRVPTHDVQEVNFYSLYIP